MRRKSIIDLSTLAAATAISCITSPAVYGAGATGTLLEEVLVHGTKASSAQAAQEIPSQISVFSAAQLEAKQVINLEDLSFSTPNVYMDSVGTQKSYASFLFGG